MKHKNRKNTGANKRPKLSLRYGAESNDRVAGTLVPPPPSLNLELRRPVAAGRLTDGQMCGRAPGISAPGRGQGMDLNLEYAAHQQALMRAGNTVNDDDRLVHPAEASGIAGRIGAFQQGLGAAAACVWSMAQFSAARRI